MSSILNKTIRVSKAHPISKIRLNSDRMEIQQFHHQFWLENNTDYQTALQQHTGTHDEFLVKWTKDNKTKFAKYNAEVYKLHLKEMYHYVCSFFIYKRP